MPVSSFDPSGPALFLQIGGVALAGAMVGFALALVDRWSVKRAERLEEEQRSGGRRRRRVTSDEIRGLRAEGEGRMYLKREALFALDLFALRTTREARRVLG